MKLYTGLVAALGDKYRQTPMAMGASSGPSPAAVHKILVAMPAFGE